MSRKKNKQEKKSVPMSELSDEEYLGTLYERLDTMKQGHRLYIIVDVVLIIAAVVLFLASNALASIGVVSLGFAGHMSVIAIMLVIIALTVILSAQRPVKHRIVEAEARIEVLESELSDEKIAAAKQRAAQGTAISVVVDKKAETVSADENAADEDEQAAAAAVDTQMPANGTKLEETALTAYEANDAKSTTSFIGGTDEEDLQESVQNNAVSRNLSSFFRIFERGVRNPLTPDTDEYRSMRATWRMIVGAGGGVMVAALIMYALMPQYSGTSTAILLISFALIGYSFYYDRKKLKPIRRKWAHRDGLSEFEARHQMTLNRNPADDLDKVEPANEDN